MWHWLSSLLRFSFLFTLNEPLAKLPTESAPSLVEKYCKKYLASARYLPIHGSKWRESYKAGGRTRDSAKALLLEGDANADSSSAINVSIIVSSDFRVAAEIQGKI